MSKYFSFLRKKRNPSLRDEETEFFSSKNGGRKKSGPRNLSTPQPQKLSTSSASLSSQPGDDNRHSIYSLDSYDLNQGTIIDPFQSDSDSLLDNTSVEGADVASVDEKRVAVEAEFEEDILEKASEVFEKVGAIKHAVCTYVEEDDEGHVIEYDDDDDNENLIDDFMDEALYNLEENAITSIDVEEGKPDTGLDDKSQEDPSSHSSPKNIEESPNNLLTWEENSVGSTTPENENKTDHIAHDDGGKFNGDDINIKRVELLASMLQETDGTECIDAKPISVAEGTPEEEVGVEFSSKEVSSKELSQDLLLKSCEMDLKTEKDFKTVEDLEFKHSSDNVAKDNSKKLSNLESSDSNIEVFLTDIRVNESKLSRNNINEDQSDKGTDCDKLVSSDKTEECTDNNHLIDIPNVEENKLVSADIYQIKDDSVLPQENEKLNLDATEVEHIDKKYPSSDTLLKNLSEDEGGGRKIPELAESLNFGEVSVEAEFIIEDVGPILNNQDEGEIKVHQIKQDEMEKEICTNNLKNSDESNVTTSNNYNNNGDTDDTEPLVAILDNSDDRNIISSADTISSSEISNKDEIDMEELSDQLILNTNNTESKDSNFSSPSSGQASDAEDDDEFDSAKEDFSNEEEDNFNKKAPISEVSTSENEEVKENQCSIVAEDDKTKPDEEINTDLEKSNLTETMEVSASPLKETDQLLNDALESKADLLAKEALANGPDQLEKEALPNGDDQVDNVDVLTKNLDSQNISSSGDPVETESSETLSLLLSSAAASKYSLLNRRNSSSGIETGAHGNRRRNSSTSDSSNLRFIECGERNYRKSLSQPDDREFIPEEPEKKIQLVTEDNFLLTTVNADHQKAEAKLAQRRAARAEARELRLRELEKQQQQEQQENNEEEEQYAASSYSPGANAPVSRTPVTPRTRSSVPVNSLSRMSSEDSLPDDHLPSSARELKADLQELEEKFRKAMVLNAQLDNEKATLMYEVEFLKDKYTDLEEAHIQLTKEHKKKSSENEQLRKLSNKLKEEVKMVRRVLQERDELIQEYGLVLIGEENGEESYEDMDDEERTSDTIMDLSPRKIGVKKALLSQEASELLAKGAAKGSLDVRLRKYAEDKHELEDEVRRLKLLLEEELSNKRRENGLDYEKHKETTKSLNEFKFKIQKAEAEVSTLQANVARLESLVARYKASTEELEKSEEELKSEKRRLQRELREAKERCDELETSKAYVKRQYEKLLHDRGRV